MMDLHEHGVEPAPNGHKTVLVVEDDRELNDLLVDLLSLMGYRVIRAYDGGEAFRMIANEHPDVVTLDLMLPGMLGQDVLRRIKADPGLKDIPFVIVTGFAERLSIEDRKLANAVITKPFEVDRLLAEVERLTA